MAGLSRSRQVVPLHLSLFTFHALLTLRPSIAHAQAIADNSFLIEEAYNQEAGVVQHISTFSRVHGGTWAYAFTQEWPLGGVSHQLSYSVPVVNPPGAGAGLGDIAVNYRYQLVGGEGPVAMAPRASVLLPTGSEVNGRGNGDPGLQVNLPVSWVLGAGWVTHWNAGVTLVGAAADANLGASVIWRPRQRMNLLLEAVWLDPDGGYLNPGVRWSHDFASGLQVVPGISYTIAVGPDAGPDAVFLYLSLEHPFRH